MSKPPTEKVTIRLREGDSQYLSDVFRQQGYNAAIRSLVSKFVDAHREQVLRTKTIVTAVPLDIEI